MLPANRNHDALLLALMLAAAACMVWPPHTFAADPASQEECVRMTRAPVQEQCRTLFAGPGQVSQRAACLDGAADNVASVCERFFGEGKDFCAVCTSACTGNFTPGDDRRRECLDMCLAHPGCR